MRQLLIPIILVSISIGLFVLWTNPTYQAAKEVLVEVKAYNEALNKSQELRRTRDEKVAAFNTFTAEDKERLVSILPDNVDNIHLIIDINTIATRHGLSLKNVSLGEISDSATSRNALAVGASGSPIGSVELGFGITASYNEMLAFMHDLEHSLRVMDIEKMDFNAGVGNETDYSFTIRTYWLH